MGLIGIWGYTLCVFVMDAYIGYFFIRPKWYFPTSKDLCIANGNPPTAWCISPASVSMCLIGVLLVHALLFWLFYTGYRKVQIRVHPR